MRFNIGKFINEAELELSKSNLRLDREKIIREHELVINDWKVIVKNIKNPIKFLIVGEATVSYSNYFYNLKATKTPFLNPADFGCQNKTDLIRCFNSNGILVFDLYPLPLPTFIYDNVKFDCTNPNYCAELNNYYDSVKSLIDDETKIVLRYKKLEKRCEWSIFLNHIDKANYKHDSIASQNMGASRKQIQTSFNGILPFSNC